MTQRERYTQLAVSIDGFEPDSGTITGTAAAYSTPIQRGTGLQEMIKPGAFAKQLADPGRVKILWQHDTRSLIGRVHSFDDNPTRLGITAKIIESAHVPQAMEALALLREGMIDELSVGFDWVKFSESKAANGDMRITHETARLREISLVTFGALGRKARVQTVAHEKNCHPSSLASIRARFDKLNS